MYLRSRLTIISPMLTQVLKIMSGFTRLFRGPTIFSGNLNVLQEYKDAEIVSYMFGVAYDDTHCYLY